MDLNFRTYGSGTPLVILHGLFGSLNNWHSHAVVLGERFRVCVPDQRNHGASPHVPEMSYEAMAGDLLECLERTGIAPVHLVGHSMGGKTAMQFALTHPREVRKLVVVDIRPQGDPPHHERILAAMGDIDWGEIKSRDDAGRALSSAVPDLAVRQFLLTNLKRRDDGSYCWKVNLDAISKNYEKLIGPLEAGGQFAGPALFLSGGRSTYIGESDRPGILALFPRAEFAEIPGAGHWVHADAPEEFRQTVADFLET